MSLLEPPVVLVLRCKDAPGITAAVAKFVETSRATIVDSSHFVDPLQSQLCLRVAFAAIDGTRVDMAALRAAFAALGRKHAMEWQMFDGAPVRTVLMVSRFGHCLFELAHLWREGLLPIAIDAVVSNHETHRDFVEWAGLPT